MLVLTRRPGQKLIISDKITVSIVSVGRGRVQIGIEAPLDISVRRIASSRPEDESINVKLPSGNDAASSEPNSETSLA